MEAEGGGRKEEKKERERGRRWRKRDGCPFSRFTGSIKSGAGEKEERTRAGKERGGVEEGTNTRISCG